MQANKWVQLWLAIGLFMLIVQVMVGGITRLTGSGLSITEWDIVTGSIPPVSEQKWIEEFDLYKETPQYREINEGMVMGSIFQSGTFKFIYFWEWVHRFWARIMGFVFIIPLGFFLFKKWIHPPLLRKLGVVFLLAALAASFGWIMVASGLVERPWVNAYKLSFHLCIAFSVFGYLWWTYLGVKFSDKDLVKNNGLSNLYKLGLIFTVLLGIQIFIGGIMSGMKAGVVYPTWPDMNGQFIPQIIFNTAEWNVENFNYYDRNEFMPALIHVLHRTGAYILSVIGLWYFYQIRKTIMSKIVLRGNNLLIILLITQVVLGILTVINCQGYIPVLYGVAHQMTALFLFSAALYLNFIMRFEKINI
jgi:cytochrome c oxidase assembly protein subunit 15